MASKQQPNIPYYGRSNKGHHSSVSKDQSWTSKTLQKIFPAGLPIIDVTSGPDIIQIRDAIQTYCQKEIGPISDIFIDGKFAEKKFIHKDIDKITKDDTGIEKAHYLNLLKLQDLEDLLYEKSKKRLYGLLHSITTKELDERILAYIATIEASESDKNPTSSAEKKSSVESEKAASASVLRASPKGCPLFLWQCIMHVTTTRVMGNYIIYQDNNCYAVHHCKAEKRRERS
jgi:hypothetical protein